jgi:hypothetical protein
MRDVIYAMYGLGRTPDRVARSAIARSGVQEKLAAKPLDVLLEGLDPGSSRRLAGARPGCERA